MSAATLPRRYYRVLGASGLSNLADGIRMAAFPLLAATLTDSATLLALVFAAGEAPWVVFGLWAGKVADQVDRRQLLHRVTLARAVLLVALAALIVAGAAPLWLVAVAAFVLGVAEVLADSVTGTLVPSLVPEQQLERANSRMVAVQITGNELVGPALGGLLFAVGAALPFVTNGTLLALALLLLAGLPVLQGPIDDDEDDAGPSAPLRLLDGVPFIRARPVLRSITWSSAILAAVDAAWFALLVLFVREQLVRSGPLPGRHHVDVPHREPPAGHDEG
ncbi:MAG: MFS transporter, partial [Actinomycetota bacterium]